MSDLSNMLAVARDAALEALDRGEPVGWIGGRGPMPNAHYARLLVACPVVGATAWAVRRLAGDDDEWFFTPHASAAGYLLTLTITDERKLTPRYFWTLQRVQEEVAHALGLLDLSKIPERAQRPISLVPRTPNEDQARARRREKRRVNMMLDQSLSTPARFDTRPRRTR